MPRSERGCTEADLVPRRHLIAALVLLLAGCTGEPEPLRSKDPAKVRAAMLRRRENPNRSIGLPKRPQRPRTH